MAMMASVPVLKEMVNAAAAIPTTRRAASSAKKGRILPLF